MRILALLIILAGCVANAQEHQAFVEFSGTASSGDYAPLWLSSNRQGVVSPYASSAYERIGYEYSLHQDTTRNWHMRAAADFILSQNAQQKLAVHQLFADVSYKKLHLIVGQRERRIDMRYNRLTSGGLSQGINAQPIPEAMVDVDFFSMPLTDHWWKVSGRIGYGMTTDGRWQKEWIDNPQRQRYTTNFLYHEKVLIWKIGDEKRFPLVFEPSLLMMTQFGGTTRNYPGAKGIIDIPHAEDLNAFWHAFWPMGSEGETDGVVKNVAGNTVGSYNFALSWHGKDWKVRTYIERMFEDQSMLTVQYGIFDHLIGADIELPRNPYVSHILVEHMSSKDQAGPVFHDSTENIPESYTGIDNYYNHSLYPGWQNYGMSIGTPLLTSPIYNKPHALEFLNNRVRALHIGLDGNPTDELSWRILATWTRNWGTFKYPLDEVRNQQYFLAEASYRPMTLPGWQATVGIGYDHGDLEFIGNSIGAQLTIRKSFNLCKQ